MKKLAILISGGGSLMEHVIKNGVPVELVVADRPCKGLEIADDRGVRNLLIDKDEYGVKPKIFDDARDRFSQKVAQELNLHGIDLVSMAGWDTIVTRPYFKTFRGGPTINNHPAILPAFKGSSRAVRDAFRAGVLVTGYTIHVATEVVDQGQILEQEAVRVLPEDTEESLHERIKKLERRGLVRVLGAEMGLPTESPYCYRCAVQMVEAQSSYACTSCDATSKGEL